MKSSREIYLLYLVTDAGLSQGRSHRQIVEAAIRGGVTLVQYREKSASTRQMVEEGSILCAFCHAYHIPFIVNDRVDVAMATGADGVHVGQDDLPASLARQLLGPDKIVGVSVENIEQVQKALADGADYVGASPVFSTPTKPDAPPPVGLSGLRIISHASLVPVVAIGGLNSKNAAEVMQAGAAGVAVVSAIVSAEDPEKAARELRQIIDAARLKPRMANSSQEVEK
jgi:thiamine-phosphate pyrophosphorylase